MFYLVQYSSQIKWPNILEVCLEWTDSGRPLKPGIPLQFLHGNPLTLKP